MNRRDFLRLAMAAPAVAASKHFLTPETAKAALTNFPLLSVQFGGVADAAEMGWTLQAAASVFDIIVGSYGLFTPQNVATLKGGKPKLLCLYRTPYTWYPDLENAGDYTEEMFAHDEDGNRIPDDMGGFYNDPGNEPFRDLISSTIAGYVNQFDLDGAFLDGPAADYAYTPTWHLDTLELLAAIRLAVPPPKVVITNSLMSYTPSGQGTELDFAPFVDVYALEYFMSTWPWESDPDTIYDIDYAHATIDASQKVLDLGKALSVFSGFTFNPDEALKAQWKAFQYAGCLMIVTPLESSFWSWGYNRYDEYDFPELNLDIGDPLGPAIRVGDVYTREFLNYTVVCDLATATGTYVPKFGPKYKPIYKPTYKPK